MAGNLHPAIGNYLSQLTDYCANIHAFILGGQVGSQDFGNTLTSLDAHLAAGKSLSSVLPQPLENLVTAVTRDISVVRQLIPQLQQQGESAERTRPYAEASSVLTKLQGMIEGYRLALEGTGTYTAEPEATKRETPPYTVTGKGTGAPAKPPDAGKPK